MNGIILGTVVKKCKFGNGKIWPELLVLRKEETLETKNESEKFILYESFAYKYIYQKSPYYISHMHTFTNSRTAIKTYNKRDIKCHHKGSHLCDTKQFLFCSMYFKNYACNLYYMAI
jgi:hypothetical protein